MSVIPSTVKIGAMIYSVTVVPDMYADRSLYGEVIYATHTIKIAADISPARQLNTFIHEVYHAIRFEAGEIAEQDEREIRSISNLLTQVIVDNGWSVADR